MNILPQLRKKLSVFLLLFSFFSSTLMESGNLYASNLKGDPDVEFLSRIENAFDRITENVQSKVVFISISKFMEAPRSNYFFLNPFEELFRGAPQGRRFRQPRSQPKPKKYEQKGLGSGFIIDINKGYILTNNHVVGDADEITVKTFDQREFKAQVIGTDAKTDVAVIQVKNLPRELGEIELGDSESIKIGQWAIAVGAPHGLAQTVTRGTVSAKGRKGLNITGYEDFIQTDAAINPGNSGGPLINIYGQAIGMNTAIFSRSGGSQGIGFAIPANILKDVSQKLIKDGKIKRAYLGVFIQNLNKELAAEFKLDSPDGALVADVEKGGPAERAGLQSGDVILSINGDKIKDREDLSYKVAMSPIGQEATFEVARKGKVQKFKVPLSERENADQDGAGGNRGKSLQNPGIPWGMQLTDKAHQQGLAEEPGVYVLEVEPNSSASRFGVSQGDKIVEVNHKAVSSLRDFAKAIGKRKKALLRVQRGNYFLYIRLKR